MKNQKELYMYEVSKSTYISDGRLCVEVVRVNNSVMGSPMYHILPISFLVYHSHVVDYNFKMYYTVRTYNILDVIKKLFAEYYSINIGNWSDYDYSQAVASLLELGYKKTGNSNIALY